MAYGKDLGIYGQDAIDTTERFVPWCGVAHDQL